MIDLHTHILPGIDDGATSWDMAEKMCLVAINDGITHVVCTPHANEKYSYDRECFARMLGQLGRAVGDGLKLTLGCDFHFSYENIQEVTVRPEQFLISGSRYLLVELSDYAIPPAVGDSLLRLISMGITPVITHPERNLLMQQRPEHALWFAQQGCVIQVTANSFTGFWGGGAKKMARWLLEHDAVHVIASDAHDLEFRPPILSKARTIVEDLAGKACADALVKLNPAAIVAGKPLPYFPAPLVR